MTKWLSHLGVWWLFIDPAALRLLVRIAILIRILVYLCDYLAYTSVYAKIR